MDFAKNGVITHGAESGEEAINLLAANPFWCTHGRNFRIVIIEEDVRLDVINIVREYFFKSLHTLILILSSVTEPVCSTNATRQFSSPSMISAITKPLLLFSTLQVFKLCTHCRMFSF